MSTPTPERLVASARAMRKQSQTQLAARLREITGDDWQGSNIGAIENERRALKASELKAFAWAQGVKPTWYLGDSLEIIEGDGFDADSAPHLNSGKPSTHLRVVGDGDEAA